VRLLRALPLRSELEGQAEGAGEALARGEALPPGGLTEAVNETKVAPPERLALPLAQAEALLLALPEREDRGVLDGDAEAAGVREGAKGLRDGGPDIVAPPPLAEAKDADAAAECRGDEEACTEAERSLDAEPPLGEGMPDGTLLVEAEEEALRLWLERALLLTLPVVVGEGEGLKEKGREALFADDGDAGAL